MIIYVGTKETIKKQLDCKHSLVGPCMDKYFRYNECIKCSVRNYDIRTEEQFYKTLTEKNEDEEVEVIDVKPKIPDLLTGRPFTLNWYGFKKDNDLKEGETHLRNTFTIEEIKKCIDYQNGLGLVYNDIKADIKLSKKEQEEQDEEFSGRICAEPGCYNYPMSGIIYCIRCMHGSPQKASDEVIAWKKRKEKVKQDYKCPKCGRLGFPSIRGNFCTDCYSEECD